MYAIKSMDTPRAGEERHSPHLRQDREDLGADGGGGADCLSIDNEASLTEAKLAVGGRARIMGNVRPSEIMLQGTPAEVRQAVFAGVAEAWDSPKGYIVASGCSLPTETPFVNIQAMMDAVTELGWPINPEKLKTTLQG